MAYTLKEIFEALGKIENGGAMVADLQDAISQVRQEAASNRVARNKVLDALGLRDGDNVDEAIKKITDTLTTVRQVGNPLDIGSQMQSLQQQIKELTDKYTASEKKAAAEREKRIQTSITSQLTKALADGKAIKPDMLTNLLIQNVQAKDDDSLVYKDGDKEVSIADGVKSWLAANEWAVRNDSSGGAGSGAPGNGGTVKRYTNEELSKMSRDEINAHWEEISKGAKS